MPCRGCYPRRNRSQRAIELTAVSRHSALSFVRTWQSVDPRPEWPQRWQILCFFVPTRSRHAVFGTRSEVTASINTYRGRRGSDWSEPKQLFHSRPVHIRIQSSSFGIAFPFFWLTALGTTLRLSIVCPPPAAK